MNLVRSEHILKFEKQMASHLIERFQLDLSALVYDGTNFFTYINTRTPAQLSQRGHNKQKRGDLSQVSLGLLVSADLHIPLFHQVYAGNVYDSVQFRSVTAELATITANWLNLARTSHWSSIKANNSEAGLQAIPFHFVGSLVATHSTPQGLELTFHRDSEALEQLSRVQLGKTILFTDNQDWTDEQIVLAYRSQYHIEDAFRQMKDP
jgi:transposase